MVGRWLQENKRFLAIVAGALLMLWVFHSWFFVGPKRQKYQRSYRSAIGGVGTLKKLYRAEDPPVNKRLKQWNRALDEAENAFEAMLARYAARPVGAFVLPGEQAKDGADAYYFTQREKVLDEIQQAATDAAVVIADGALGLRDSTPDVSPAEMAATIRRWLWHVQIVRHAVAAAVTSGVDTINRVQINDSMARRKSERDGENVRVLEGTPVLVDVTGEASACVAWLQSMQRDDSYLILIVCKIKRDERRDRDDFVNVQAVVMGVQHTSESVETAEDEG